MSYDIKSSKNIRERPTKELMQEYKQKEKEQKQMDRSQKEAIRENRRRDKLTSLQQRQQEQKMKLQEQVSVQKQKAEIKRLKQETGLVGKARRLQKQVEARKKSLSRKNVPKYDGSGRGTRANKGRGGCTTTRSTGKTKVPTKVYFINNIPYHYKNGKMVEIRITTSKPKKKKETWGL